MTILQDHFSEAAVPVSFSGMAGLYAPVRNGVDAAVLFVSPWALEDMCARKFWRVISERLSGHGIASLRFDLPGTGDSLDPDFSEGGIALWDNAVVEAAQTLRRLSGVSRIFLVGQGLGATLAMQVAARVEGLAGIAALAPVTSGRFFLRELSAMSRMVDDSLGLSSDYREHQGVSIAGFILPDAIAAGLRSVDLMKLEATPSCPVLIGERASRTSDSELFAFLAALGTDVERMPFDGYDALTANPAVSVVPQAFAHAVADWVAGHAPKERSAATNSSLPKASSLDGGHFIETAVRFGDRSPLYGVLTRPACEPKGATVLFLSTAYDRHAGWGRATANMARDMARQGIVSLRFDNANVADSPPAPGAPEQVLYTDGPQRDLSSALDFLKAQGAGPIVVAGRCSGAYVAFQGAVEDRRVSGAAIANPPLFHWNPDNDVDARLRSTPRALGDYGQRLLQISTVSRLLKGEIDLIGAFLNISRATCRRLFAPVGFFIRHYTQEGRAVHAAFHAIAERKVPLSLFYSETDPGLDHFASYFGADGKRLGEYGIATFKTVANADHNLTPACARDAFRDEVQTLALRF